MGAHLGPKDSAESTPLVPAQNLEHIGFRFGLPRQNLDSEEVKGKIQLIKGVKGWGSLLNRKAFG